MASSSWADRKAFPRPARFEVREVLLYTLLLPLVFAPAFVEKLAARAVAAYLFRPGGTVRDLRLAKIPPELSARTALSPLNLARRCEAEAVRERIRVLRGIVFPWWRRRLRTSGYGHVRAGLARGRGVILWIHFCAESHIAVKQAMFQAGEPLAHLSRPGHPFSNFPFSVRFIDPVLRRPEVRFLSERVVIDGEHVVTPLRRLRRLLAENRAVSITVTYVASTVYAYPFLGGTLKLPAGPIELSAATDAPLLPVFTWSEAGRTRVEFGAPVLISGSGPDAVREAHRWAMAWLEERVVAHPEAWTAWRTRQFAV